MPVDCKDFGTVTITVNDVEYDAPIWGGNQCNVKRCLYSGSLDESGDCRCLAGYTGPNCELLIPLPDMTGYVTYADGVYTPTTYEGKEIQSVPCGGEDYQLDNNLCGNCPSSEEVFEYYEKWKIDYSELGYNDNLEILAFSISIGESKNGIKPGIISLFGGSAESRFGSGGYGLFGNYFKINDLITISMNEKYIGDGFNYPNWMFFKVKSFNTDGNQMIVESIDQKTDEAIDLILPKKTDDDGNEINEVVTEDTIVIFNPFWNPKWPKNTSLPVADQVVEPKLYVFRDFPESGNNNTTWETEKFVVPGSKEWSIGLRGDYCQIVYTGVYEELEYDSTDILDDNSGNLDFLNDDYLDDPDKIPKFAGGTPGGVDDSSNEFCDVEGTNDADLIKSQADAQEKTIKAAMRAMNVQACKSDYACVTAEVSTLLGSADASACAQSTVGCEQVVANFSNTVNAQKQISCFIKETIQSNEFNIVATNEANITVGKDSECCAACGKGTAVALDGHGNPIYTTRQVLEDGSVLESGVSIVKVQCTQDICDSSVTQSNSVKVAVNTQFSTQDVTNIQKKLAVAIAHDIENLQTSVRDGERNVTPMPPGSKSMNVSSQINSTLQMDKTLNRNIQEALYNVTSSNITNLDIGEGVTFQGPCFNINQENMIEFQVSAMMDAAFNSISGTDAMTDLGTKIKNTQEQRSTSTDEEGGLGMLPYLAFLFSPLILFFVVKNGYARAAILVFNSIGYFLAGYLLGSLEESFLVSASDLLDDSFGDIIEILEILSYIIGAAHIIAAIVFIYLEFTKTNREIVSEDIIAGMQGEDQGRALERNRRNEELNTRSNRAKEYIQNR